MARGLSIYNAKRDFKRTQEPRGQKGRAKGNSFVVQKHAATRLHYDFRLELDGVLLSWAVTRGPSLVPGEKRLAVQVEDHPLDYANFEGVIPEGQYGGGAVIVWDRGTWMPEGDPHKGLKKGQLDFSLDGEKLAGGWHLVRMAKRHGERRDNWLLIKAKDETALSARDPDILEAEPQSVISGRTIEEMAADKKAAVWNSNRSDDEAPKRARKTAAKSATKPAARRRTIARRKVAKRAAR
jgi:bifunctional non-homologous end joining protein LigD